MATKRTLGKTKNWSTREFTKILSNNGYKYLRGHGDHYIYYNEEINRKIVINKNINKMVCRRLLKEYDLKF